MSLKVETEAKFFLCNPADSPTTSDAAKSDNDIATKRGKKTVKKTSYPCGISSSGQAWLLHCAECKQVWHNVCAGLKADFTKHVLDSLFRSWQCPWCYTCPYPRSDNHHSVKREQELKDKLLTAETIQCIKESVSKVIERALPMN